MPFCTMTIIVINIMSSWMSQLILAYSFLTGRQGRGRQQPEDMSDSELFHRQENQSLGAVHPGLLALKDLGILMLP